ncbi:hypothetical protein [Ralstonia pickettii]|uniref:Uncharacterized protein n=1 Tax=Ralstonia pickettii TaxID=329 RepID=A0AAW4Q5Q8_RALPI|nr:hypothetical protein [Ralstonia pickettii]MBA9846780.1 hypothetical protein [Ralstonia pickettii]MBA9852068.1 hypothetical protein [Ralstonia pickettii]MBA9919917.1 hypothetical protein [Ralstonia pickettii]MBA9959019.1 hypothetical protein [Ralstonia pickettii]MBA9964602.1 hypothetical protein [Ralstonia pickettii]
MARFATMIKSKIDRASLPDGWVAEQHPSFPDVAVLTRPNGGFVSIDLQKRIFSLGYCRPHFPMNGAAAYEGRGWKSRIVADAVAWLDRQMA